MKLLTVKEVAEMIRAKPATVYQWAGKQVYPLLYNLTVSSGSQEDDIFAWIKNCKKNPIFGV